MRWPGWSREDHLRGCSPRVAMSVPVGWPMLGPWAEGPFFITVQHLTLLALGLVTPPFL